LTSDDEYALLAGWWHGTTPADKKQHVSIINKHCGFTVDCVKELFTEMHVPVKEMQHLRVCYELATRHPEQLEMELPVESAIVVAPEVKAAQEAQKPATHGLRAFELKPVGLKGLELFEHLTTFARRRWVGSFQPSAALNVEMTADQTKIFAPTPQDLASRELMKDAGGEGATLRLAKRKLDAIGDIKAHCCVANAPERIERIKRGMELAASLAAISRADNEEKKKKKTQRLSLCTTSRPRPSPSSSRRATTYPSSLSRRWTQSSPAILPPPSPRATRRSTSRPSKTPSRRTPTGSTLSRCLRGPKSPKKTKSPKKPKI
jgi:hypothetical protein